MRLVSRETHFDRVGIEVALNAQQGVASSADLIDQRFQPNVSSADGF
jgi:hypothetical protein